MGLLIGVDEAGYGPNLGPLVVAATAWSVPGDPRSIDLWQVFGDVVYHGRSRDERRIGVADSKVIYSPAGGLSVLERPVRSLLALGDCAPQTFSSLWEHLSDSSISETVAGPWLADSPLVLPADVDGECDRQLVARWRDTCADSGVSLVAVRCGILTAAEFNRLLERYENKAELLSQASLGLVRALWPVDGDEPALFVCDKHGGRNRYAHLLADCLEGRFVVGLEERREVSRYRVDGSEIRFQRGAESELPVALASMVAKYVRELVMLQFNRFWCKRVEGLRETRGYPVDARRFRDEVEPVRRELQIADDMFWRRR